MVVVWGIDFKDCTGLYQACGRVASAFSKCEGFGADTWQRVRSARVRRAGLHAKGTGWCWRRALDMRLADEACCEHGKRIWGNRLPDG